MTFSCQGQWWLAGLGRAGDGDLYRVDAVVMTFLGGRLNRDDFGVESLQSGLSPPLGPGFEAGAPSWTCHLKTHAHMMQSCSREPDV